MSTFINSLSSEQIEFAITVYGSITDWIAQCSIVVEDLMI